MNLKVPFFDAKGASFGVDLSDIMNKVLDSKIFVLGQNVLSFEKAFSDYIGAKYCISVASGTDALILALKAAGINAGDEVATAANAGFYSSIAILRNNAKPVYIDVDYDKLTLSAEKLNEALANNKKIKCVIVTHLYGQIADIIEIKEICKKNNIILIEDCAQAHGAQINNKLAGSFGDISCFSFYPTKNLGAIGDGGAIITNNEYYKNKINSLRQYGWTNKYHVVNDGGINSRLDELQAAVLLAKLNYLDEANQARRKIASNYQKSFKNLPIKLPFSIKNDYAAHLYVIRTEKRNELREYLLENKIYSDIHYPVADYLQKVFLNQVPNPYADIKLPITEKACEQVLSLPCYVGMSEAQQEIVINTVINFYK